MQVSGVLPIPRRLAHVVFATLQSCLTTGVSTAIAVQPFGQGWDAAQTWLAAWAASWAVLLPLVIVAAPALRQAALALTREDATLRPPSAPR
jgi:hypothetical protein